MNLPGCFATGQSTGAFHIGQSAGSSSTVRSPVRNNLNSVYSKLSHQPSASYVPGINILILKGPGSIPNENRK